MMSLIRNKQRLIHLYRYLLENTDEDHQVTTNDLVEFLKKEDANASRKTVKDDIEILILEGIDIVTTKSYYNSYFVGSRLFEMPEIKLMVDGLAANVSLTGEQKDKINDKLLSTLSVYQAEKLRNAIAYTDSRGSEHFYYSIDRITDAICENKKIAFQYFDYNAAGDKVLRDNGQYIVITPFVITCNFNRYYVLGYQTNLQKIVTYRLDLMTRTKILSEQGDPKPTELDLSEYMKGLFQMQCGPVTEIVLECKNNTMLSIIDKFGDNVDTWKSTVDSFYIKVSVSVSNAFYAWVFKHGGDIRIISPNSVVNGYMDMVRNAIKQDRKNGKA